VKTILPITAAVSSACVFFVQGQTAQDHFVVKATLRSPNSTRELVVISRPSRLGGHNPPEEFIGKVFNGSFVEATNLAYTVYRREYHGNGWVLGREQHWIDDRFAWMSDDFGLFIADVETNTILVNNVLEAYAKNPLADKWVGIRFRPSARMQEYLEEDFQDTLLFLDPTDMAAQASRDLPKDSLAHVKSMRTDGVALGPPEWTPDASRFAVLVWKSGAVSAVQYDTKLRETARTAIDLHINRETALSVWLKKELAAVVKRILSDPRTF
jgi:hypothetical protein